MTAFFKNLGMMGGLLQLALVGGGAWSLDARTLEPVSQARR